MNNHMKFCKCGSQKKYNSNRFDSCLDCRNNKRKYELCHCGSGLRYDPMKFTSCRKCSTRRVYASLLTVLCKCGRMKYNPDLHDSCSACNRTKYNKEYMRARRAKK